MFKCDDFDLKFTKKGYYYIQIYFYCLSIDWVRSVGSIFTD